MPANSYNVKARSYATSHFRVTLDDKEITAFVKNVEGGLVKADSVEEKSGVANAPLHHASTRTIEPITLELGMCQNNWLLEAVADVVNNRVHARFDGQIDYGDANYNTRFTHEFTRALITEITLPTFDPSAKDPAFIKLKLQPESSDFGVASGGKLSTGVMAPHKLWQPNAFRLDLDSGNLNTSKITKIEGMTIKIGTKAAPVGPHQLPSYLPTVVTMPKLSIHMPLHGANDIIGWYRSSIAAVASSRSDAVGYEVSGGLSLLDQARQKDLYTFNFFNLGPEQLTIVKGEGGGTGLKTCKLDMYMARMTMTPG